MSWIASCGTCTVHPRSATQVKQQARWNVCMPEWPCNACPMVMLRTRTAACLLACENCPVTVLTCSTVFVTFFCLLFTTRISACSSTRTGMSELIWSAAGSPAPGPGSNPLAAVRAAPVLDHSAAAVHHEYVPPPAVVEVRVGAVERCIDHPHFLQRGSLARLAFSPGRLHRRRSVFCSSNRLWHSQSSGLCWVCRAGACAAAPAASKRPYARAASWAAFIHHRCREPGKYMSTLKHWSV